MSIQDAFAWSILAMQFVGQSALTWAVVMQRSRIMKLERASKTDPLTGLGLAILLDSERWYAALRSNRPLCVVWVDLDHLKLRSDKYMHTAGNELIKAAAQALTMSSRRGIDEVFHLHTKGDEFVVLLHGALDVHKLAGKIREEFKRRSVMASVGIAYSTETRFQPTRSELRSKAQRKCAEAKARGGDCVLVDDGQAVPEPVDDDATERISLVQVDEVVEPILNRWNILVSGLPLIYLTPAGTKTDQRELAAVYSEANSHTAVATYGSAAIAVPEFIPTEYLERAYDIGIARGPAGPLERGDIADKEDGCPACGERRKSYLAIDEDTDHVTCATCCNEYDFPERGAAGSR